MTMRLVTDPFLMSRIYSGTGALSTRGPASAVSPGYLYFAEDDNGGTIYRSTGSAWVKAALGAGEVIPTTIIAQKSINTGFATTATSPTDVTGLTALSVTFPYTGAIELVLDAMLIHGSAGGYTIYQVIDDLANKPIEGAAVSTAADQQVRLYTAPRVTGAVGTTRLYKLQVYTLGGTCSVGGGATVTSSLKAKVCL